MATEKEAALPVEAFRGINRNVDREDMQPGDLWNAQNLWERKLGVLETRWGSTNHVTTWPSNITKVMSPKKLYKSGNESVRLAAVACTTDFAVAATLPAGISLSFVNDAQGYWNNAYVFGAVTWNGLSQNVVIRLVGYGVDKIYTIPTTSISGYTAATDQKLRVTISSSFGTNVTGFEVYAGVRHGTSLTVGNINYAETYMWVGFQELVSAATGTWDYLYVPLGQNGTAAAEIGELKRTFSASATGGGTLTPGRTYYVAVVPHHIKTAAAGLMRSTWRIPSVDRNGLDIVPVTIPADGTYGSILVNAISPATVSFMLAIGETPELLIPYKIFNDTANTFGTKTLTIDSFPEMSPAVFDIKPYASNTAYFQFKASDYSTKDMFVKIADDGTIKPMFASRLSVEMNEWDTATNPLLAYTVGFYDMGDGAALSFRSMGDNSAYNYVQEQNLLYFVNDGYVPPRSGHYTKRSGSNYMMTDGHVAAIVIEEFQLTVNLDLPVFKYIAKFEGSICLSGGPTTIDINNGLAQSAARRVYFSRAVNPYNFTIAGAASTTHQFVAAGQDSEEVNGLALYNNTSADSGAVTKLIFSKKSGLLLMDHIPTVTGGVLGSSTITALSGKAGTAGHTTIVNTPIGTIATAVDNVYLIRDNGEPAPMGQQISDILKGADLTYAFACYHDRHYKLSFFHPDYPGTAGQNNVEFWLNINKVIEQKGQPDWVGPMIGRSVQSCLVEDEAGDGLTYNDARDRFVCDGTTLRFYLADVTPSPTATVLNDFSTPITSLIETGDFPVTQQDNNWNHLIVRTYWKLRTNKLVGAPMAATETTTMDGVTFEAKACSFYGLAATNFDNQPLKLNPVYPTGRPRGRTVRKSLTTADRIGIGGFQINYSVERRRI